MLVLSKQLRQQCKAPRNVLENADFSRFIESVAENLSQKSFTWITDIGKVTEIWMRLYIVKVSKKIDFSRFIVNAVANILSLREKAWNKSYCSLSYLQVYHYTIVWITEIGKVIEICRLYS